MGVNKRLFIDVGDISQQADDFHRAADVFATVFIDSQVKIAERHIADGPYTLDQAARYFSFGNKNAFINVVLVEGGYHAKNIDSYIDPGTN